MGALTLNRKRSDDYYTFNYKFPCLSSPDSDLHISKKPKFSPSTHTPTRPVSYRSTASRFYLYPDPVPRLRREVHAPCRAPKLGFSRSNITGVRNSGDDMGNVLGCHYDKVKEIALGSLRYLKEDVEVIDVEEETVKDDVSENSSIEEVEVVENEADLMVLDEKVVEKNKLLSFLPGPDLRNGDLKVDSEGKMLDLPSVDRDFDLPLHKKLLGSAEKRNEKLSSLRFLIELNERRRATFQLWRPKKKPEEDVVSQCFVPLTKEEVSEVARALSNSNRRKVLVTHDTSNIVITGEILQCLKPGAWLNDEVINLYFELLKEREKREPQNFLKCHFFNTFFYKKLISGRCSYDFKSVRRWTTQRKLGYCLFECDKIFVPIHKHVHWCLAVINKKDKKFQYLDSLRGVDTQVMMVLARYFVDEVKDKTGNDIDVSSWKQEYVEDLPDQKNGFDCGMFMIKYADFYSRDVGLRFNQEHMPYFRLRTAKEILRLKAE